MKYRFVLATLLTLSLSANEEFPLIQPVSVEIAPIEKAVEVKAPESDADEVVQSDENEVAQSDENEVAQSDANEMVQSDENEALDSDGDGVLDEDDKCPDTKEGIAVDYRGCELDSDDDGVVDSEDNCPDTSKDFVVDGYGCPQTATLKVNFAPAKYDISEELISQLQEFALFLKENRGYQVVIYGYTDSLGRKESNRKLSQNRANSIKEVLTRYGISITRLTSIGKGDANPIADNKTKEGRAKNRRIEVELIQ